MALPRISDVKLPDWHQAPVQVAESSDRAGTYAIEQLEILLQPLLTAVPSKRERVWLPAQTIAFAVAASAILWSAILFVAIRLI
ncbi:MAG TPA: hypothetical protein VJ798_06635 [Rhizomicrobium sp.]|nr:hypothetical protein [Rhizomicrobium sp.]HKY17324.1 hypothetical protein [Rhizomicrobium sp.]